LAADPPRPLARTLAPSLDAVGEQAVLESETIASVSDAEAEPTPAGDEPNEPDERIGELIHDRYRLIRKLGRGGMGTVYLAEHASIPKTFAVKLLNPRYASRQEFAARFLLEAQAVSRIDHPNVVGIVDFGTTPDGATFLVMEHLRGEPLEALCRREAPLAWARVRHLTVQICNALQAAHEAGIIHRDIKPDNVLRMTRGEDDDYVKVLDFGLAKVRSGEGLRLTKTGMVLGTPRYMAPEQARGATIDHRVDIYALGVLIYELLCGRTPFQASTFLLMRNHHLLSKPEPPSHWAESAGITDEMDAIALRALAKDPDHRFASMLEMAEAIEGVGQGRGPIELLERATQPLGLDTPSRIADRGRLSSVLHRSGERMLPAMNWAHRPSAATSSVEPNSGPRRVWLVPAIVVLGVGVGALSVATAWQPSRERAGRVAGDEPNVVAPIVHVLPIEPASEFVALTLETNVPVRVLEARDQAILGDTHQSSTIAMPRSSETQQLLLRAEGHHDLAIELTPDRDRTLAFTLEPAPASATKPTSKRTRAEPREPEPVQDNRFAPGIRDPFADAR
jgi:serine/threonine protein kinase